MEANSRNRGGTQFKLEAPPSVPGTGQTDLPLGENARPIPGTLATGLAAGNYRVPNTISSISIPRRTRLSEAWLPM